MVDTYASQAIRRSKICKSQTKLVVFLGTPHRGSSFAGWGVIASNLANLAFQDSNKQIVRALETNGEVLDNIHDEFLEIAQGASIKVHSFQEARAITGVKGLNGKVSYRSYITCGLSSLVPFTNNIRSTVR